MTSTEVTGISDDRYWGTMGVIVISMGICWSAGEDFGCTRECRRTKAEITNELWGMPVILKIFIWRTAGVIWDSPDIQEHLISRNCEYDTWIIVHYHFWIILPTIYFNIALIASLHQRTIENGKWFQHKRRYTKTITWLSSPMISIKHGVNVIHYFSHLIRANESRNRQFINGTTKLESLVVFADYSYLVCGCNCIPMLLSSICDI